MHEPENPLDFGSGYKGRFIGWHPDRSIPANFKKYHQVQDLEKAVLILVCPHGEGAISLHPPEYDEIFRQPGWKVESWEPLTLSPSILRRECECHGYIREGRWVNA